MVARGRRQPVHLGTDSPRSTPQADVMHRIGAARPTKRAQDPDPAMSAFTRSSTSANQGSIKPMTKLTIASKLIVALLGAVSAGACSVESPVVPSPPSVIAGEQNAKGSQAAPGVYDLSFNVFQNGTYQEVSSLPVKSQELILKAYVTDSSGRPAQKGTVTFEYCSYKGPGERYQPSRRGTTGGVRAGNSILGAAGLHLRDRRTLSVARQRIRMRELRRSCRFRGTWASASAMSRKEAELPRA